MKILILPGLDGTGALVSDAVACLSARYDVTSLAYPETLSSYDDIENQIVLPTSDYVIVAESFSGPLAVRIAAQNPAGLKGVVFVATFAKAPRRISGGLIKIMAYLPITSPFVIAMGQPVLMGRWASRVFTKKLVRALRHVPKRTILDRIQQVLRVDVTDAMRAIAVPSIYLIPTHDRLVPARMAQDFSGICDAIVPVDGPHFVLQANATACCGVISDFVDRV